MNMPGDDEIVFRKFKRHDYPAIHKIFQVNCPSYFADSQGRNLSDFLDRNAQNYYVVVIGDEIVGGGGYSINYLKTAFISWVMFKPQFQNRQLGTLVLRQIIKEIRDGKKAEVIEALASQHSTAFFNKFNFTLLDVKPDFWADGLDLHRFQLKVKFRNFEPPAKKQGFKKKGWEIKGNKGA